MEGAAASAEGSFSFQPFLVVLLAAVAVVSSFIRAAARKKRSRTPAATPPGTDRNAGPHPTTLLNGVPLKGHNTPLGTHEAGFAHERMRVEAELKRQLDALDAARRAGQVTAEQYAGHREAIFKNF